MLRTRVLVRPSARTVRTSIAVRFATSISRQAARTSYIPYSPQSYQPYPIIQMLDKTMRLDKPSDKDADEGAPEKPEEPQPKEKEPKNEDKDEKPKDEDIDKKEEIEKDIKASVVRETISGTPNMAGSSGGNNGGSNSGSGSLDIKQLNSDPETGLYPPLLAIPMKDRPPLPAKTFGLNVTDIEVQNALRDCLQDKRQPYFVLFHVKDRDVPDTDLITHKDAVHDVGVLCQVVNWFDNPKTGMLNTIAYPHCRIKLEDVVLTHENPGTIDLANSPTSYLQDFKVSVATSRHVLDKPYDETDPNIKALIDSLLSLVSKVAAKNPTEKSAIQSVTTFAKNPSQFADYIASTVHAEPKKIQEVLEELDIQQRLTKVLALLKVEMKASTIKENTIRNLTSKADEYQTKAFIKEFIKELQKRAGITESEEKKTAKFDERLKHLKMTEEALEAYNAEKAKMESQHEHSSELGVTERYLDWLTSLPWGVYSKDRFNIKEARKVLERDHYGLKDVKERILEFISMGKVSGKVDGKILCLAGPPGTGKTSIAKSIAEALDRKYVRIAMGGIQDVHEVKGHRRTYVGSIPGRIIFALKQAKTSNPLMLIDEIDKLDLSRGGGAASAFLEILDPEQNNAFVDNYIDVKVDLSKVLFVCTANYLGNIPPPLRDRMEIINVPGYTNNEKVEIAKRHLIPDAAKKAGLEGGHIVIPDETIARLTEKYCRESGLRNVKKLITRIFSKSSLKIVEQIEEEESKETAGKDESSTSAPSNKEAVGSSAPDVASATVAATSPAGSSEPEVLQAGEPSVVVEDPAPVAEKLTTNPPVEKEDTEEVKRLKVPDHIKLEITPDVLKDYVGPEVYTRDRVYDAPPPGVATGLSYSSSGNGDALYIESILTHPISSGSGHPGMHVTGSLKDVMKESASIAYAFVKAYMSKNFPENRFFEQADIHVHCPDGAIPKDGPSAGIAFTSSLISLALNRPLPPNIAMTGEITVTGRVLPVGGLREKTLGAKRYGCDTIIFPKDIENELDEIPEEVKGGITFIPVEWYQQVFDQIFPNSSVEEVNSIWKDEFAKLDKKKNRKRSSSKD